MSGGEKEIRGGTAMLRKVVVSLLFDAVSSGKVDVPEKTLNGV